MSDACHKRRSYIAFEQAHAKRCYLDSTPLGKLISPRGAAPVNRSPAIEISHERPWLLSPFCPTPSGLPDWTAAAASGFISGEGCLWLWLSLPGHSSTSSSGLPRGSSSHGSYRALDAHAPPPSEPISSQPRPCWVRSIADRRPLTAGFIMLARALGDIPTLLRLPPVPCCTPTSRPVPRLSHRSETGQRHRGTRGIAL